MTIQVENGIKIAKKLSKEETLDNLRKLLDKKIPSNTVFTSSDGTEIDIEDETNIKINEILDGKKINMKMVKDQNEILAEIYANDELKYKKNLSKKSSLDIIRKSLSDIMTKETYFLADEDSQIEINEESEILLEDVLDGNKIKIKSFSIGSAPKPIGHEIPSDEKDVQEEKIVIEFYLDNKLIYNKKFLNTEKLSNTRKIISSKIGNDFNFISKENNNISQSEEENLKLYKGIIDKNKVYLGLKETDKGNKNNNNKTLIEIYINDKLDCNQKLDISENLPSIRDELGKKIKDNFQFVFPNGLKIDIDEENEYILEEILNNNKLCLYQEKSDKVTNKTTEKNDNIIEKPKINKPLNSLNEPLPGSKLINEEGNLKIYSYPEYEFTKEEESKSKKLWL